MLSLPNLDAEVFLPMEENKKIYHVRRKQIYARSKTMLYDMFNKAIWNLGIHKMAWEWQAGGMSVCIS